MWLQMYIGKMLIDQAELDYSGLITCTDKQQYQERIAVELRQKHIGEIRQSTLTPKFYVVGQPSMINLMTLSSCLGKMPEKEFFKELESESSNEFWSIIYCEKQKNKTAYGKATNEDEEV